MHDVVKSLKKTVTSSISNINKEIKKRSRKISFKDVIYYSCLLIGNNQSYDDTNTILKVDNILDVSNAALIKYKNKIDCSYFNELNNDILDHIYNEFDVTRLIAVDGTNIVLDESLKEYNFKLSNNNHYCTALISTLFDVTLGVPINYYLSKNDCERSALRCQFEYLKETDILIMDRGYYSLKLLFELYNLGINVIFRLRTGLSVLNKLDLCDDATVVLKHEGKKIQFRVLKYTVNKNIYYIGTTIYDKSIKYFKDTYWKRWKVEVNFKYSKYNLSMNNIKSKSENSVTQDIYIHNLIFIITGYIKYHLEEDICENYNINVTSLLKILINKILYLFLYKNSTSKNIDEIIRIFDIIKESLIYVRTDRHYKRIRYKPSTKWNINGNRYSRDPDRTKKPSKKSSKK